MKRVVNGIELDYERRNLIAMDVLRQHRIIQVDHLRQLFTKFKKGRDIDASVVPVSKQAVREWIRNKNLSEVNGFFVVGNMNAAKAFANKPTAIHESLVCAIAIELELFQGAARFEIDPNCASGKQPDLVYGMGDVVEAYEIELTQKSAKRYINVFMDHSKRLDEGEYQRLIYICSSEAICKAVRRAGEQTLFPKGRLVCVELSAFMDRFFPVRTSFVGVQS